jgi:riboflavin synthase alpha subunit
MFTGIIEEVGSVAELDTGPEAAPRERLPSEALA